jgi:hypothetical protein
MTLFQLIVQTDSIFKPAGDAVRRSSRRKPPPPGYYKALNSKGKEEADRLISGLFINADQFEPEKTEITLVALNSSAVRSEAVRPILRAYML